MDELGSPRLALVQTLPGEEAWRVAGWLGRALGRWSIGVRLVHDGEPPSPAREGTTCRRAARFLDGLLVELADPARLNETQDLTVILAGPASTALALCRRTRTPAVLVAPGTASAADLGSALDNLTADMSFAAALVVPAAMPAQRVLSRRGMRPLSWPTEDQAAGGEGSDRLLRRLLRMGAVAPAFGVEGQRPAKPSGTRTSQTPMWMDRLAARSGGAPLMIQGTQSSAGKSFLVTALARSLTRAGARVAPFKAQNISNNARVVDGGEIGVAQYLQAIAARVTPDIRMNPVLLKPQRARTYTVAMGRPRPDLDNLPWRFRKPILWPVVRHALDSLLRDFDVVLIEGAGSPAEPGLYDNDIVNMRVARHAGAPVILVSDAGRGGAVAHCAGTLGLLAAQDRTLVAGVIFNRYFPDTPPDHLLASAAILPTRLGVPVLGVVPELRVALPEEDTADTAAQRTSVRPQGMRIGVLAYPRMSNFDEFAAARRAGLAVSWIRDRDRGEPVDLLVLPGSKDVRLDLAWLQATGLDELLREHAEAGRPVLAICGGLQMLGEQLEDPDGVEAAGGAANAAGLGMLPLATRYHRDKVQRVARARFGRLGGWWGRLSGLRVKGYEIRHGVTRPVAGVGAAMTAALPDGLGYLCGNTLGVYLHGILEHDEVLRALTGNPSLAADPLDSVIDRIADEFERCVDMDAVVDLLTGRRPAGRPATPPPPRH